MDKTWKLQKYSRKDYSELVEFPVEIVGRDGIVRRYTFEDSIRLYQRRITFAPIRYRDLELVRAEVGHCRSRIEQLRRSYFHRFGWGTPEGETEPLDEFGDLAGELAAFICRVLRCKGRPEVSLDKVSDDEDGVSLWYLTLRGGELRRVFEATNDGTAGQTAGMLLYVHRFDGIDADTVREQFFNSLKELERMGRCAGDSERLLAFHHTVDCGFVLTGRGNEYEALISQRDEEEEEVSMDLGPTPWDGVLEVIRRGEYEQGLKRCRDLVTTQPWHRNGYVAGAMLATFLGSDMEAEELAMLGTRYFPKDGALAYYLGVALLRQDKTSEAERALHHAVELGPEMVAARAQLAVLLLRVYRFEAAERVLKDRPSHPDDRRANRDLDRLVAWLSWRRLFLALCATVSGLGALAALLVGVLGLLPLLGGALLLLGGWMVYHRFLDDLVERHRFDDVNQGLRRLNWRPNTRPPVS